MTDQDFLAEFKNQIEKSLLLEEADKQYFLQNSQVLPESALQYFYAELKPKDQLIESYLERALTDNPALADQLKQRVIKLRKQILILLEGEEKNPQELEKLLDQKLNNL